MLINSINFVFFFLVVFFVYYLIPNRYRWIILLIASYAFYASWSKIYLVYLVIPTIFIYYIAIIINREKSKTHNKLLLFIAIMISLSLLFVFKYLDLFMSSLNSFFSIQQFKPLNLLLPIGISFYIFKLISYIIDVYNNKIPPEKHIGYFALYVSFFPQILAGPIDRAINFIPELKKDKYFDWQQIINGLKQVIYGVFKKMVIADRMALYVNQVFSNPEQNAGIAVLFGIYFYSIQIYCDFSGYTDIAIGISRMLGIKSMENFNFPYFSKSLTEFWNRWHISLSTWLRDYLFLPISYSILRHTKKNKYMSLKVEQLAYSGGMSVTMLLGGLWHGANWTFVIWGLLHGFYLVFANLTKKMRKRLYKKMGIKKTSKARILLSYLITFNLVSFAWIFFRASSFEDAIIYIKNISFKYPNSGYAHLIFTLFFAILFISIELIMINKAKLITYFNIPVSFKLIAYAFFVCFIIVFSVDGSNEFIYFQF